MTKDTQPTKPSAGALRAAKVLQALPTEPFKTDYIALIIDREAGVAELSQQVANLQRANDEQARKLAELLEATKMVGSKIESDHKASVKYGGRTGLFFTSQELEQLEQAIAKCKGGE